MLTELYKGLVTKGDFGSAEDIIVASLTEEVLQEYISKFRYKPDWKLLKPINADGMRLTWTRVLGPFFAWWLKLPARRCALL